MQAANQNGGQRNWPVIFNPSVMKFVELENGFAIIRLLPVNMMGDYLPILDGALPHPQIDWETLYKNNPLSRPGFSGKVAGHRAQRPSPPAKPKPSFLTVVK